MPCALHEVCLQWKMLTLVNVSTSVSTASMINCQFCCFLQKFKSMLLSWDGLNPHKWLMTPVLRLVLLIDLLHAHWEGCKKGCTGCNYQLVIFLRASSALYLAGTPSASISFSFLCRTAYVCNHVMSSTRSFILLFIHQSNQSVIHSCRPSIFHLYIQYMSVPGVRCTQPSTVRTWASVDRMSIFGESSMIGLIFGVSASSGPHAFSHHMLTMYVVVLNAHCTCCKQKTLYYCSSCMRCICVIHHSW